MFTANAAPHWSRQFRSDDLGEVRALIGNKDGPHSRVVHGDRPLGYAMYQVSAHHTNLGGSESAVSQVVRGHVHGWVLHLALPPGTVLRSGLRTSAHSGPNTAVLIPPGWAFTRISPPGALFAAEVDAHALMGELQARRPDEVHRNLRRMAMPELATGERRGLLAAASELVLATEPGSDDRQQASAEGRFIERMVDLVLRDAVTRRPGELALERARNLEAWIDAHLGEPITMGALCQVAGVGERCLQKSFLYRRGISPMRFVAERRLLAAHQWLADASHAATVTEAGLRFGFPHLGRFSVSYRQAIGESPSQTLAAAKRRA
ncbi:putative Transcriptional regulator, AraC family [Rubrivivax sp. A210]|uniref:helix-turn-helix transcriptional regulator n=1 Tax=Rubrivivax sp. A210 TaxID=2772301 RepID=UPI00191985E5|nr:helix-turn-helix transcriptional regulator [Rubrivivax sp. A210]CAD5372918.1 putative Transcriptional regulator, AraC family [Rubrivivax sp. A210]